MSEEKKKSDDTGGTVALVLLCVGALVALLPPILLGWAIYCLLRQSLGRKEGVALAGVGFIGMTLMGAYTFPGYLAWLKTLVRALMGNQSWSAVLWFPRAFPLVLLGAATVAGLLAALNGTKLGRRFGKIVPTSNTVATGRGLARLFGGSRSATEDDLNDAATREAIIAQSNVVAPPTGGLTVNAGAHSVLAPTEPGKRSFPIGLDAQGAPVYLTENEIRTHGLILGATGSGKSETIKSLAGCLLDLGWSGLILDLKEDTAPGGLRDWCHTYATVHSLQYQELCLSDPESPYWFNSLHGMGPDEMRDAILALQEFEAAYYEALNKELLGQLINLMWAAHQADPKKFPYPTAYDVAKICGSSSMPKATAAMRAVVLATVPGWREADFLVLSNPSVAQQQAATGFGARLGNIFDTVAGRTVLRQNAEGTRIAVDVTNDGLTYIGLDSQGKADLTAVVSSAVLQRLSVYAAQRTTGLAKKDKPRFVIVDEANWVNREIVKNLLSRARSAGIALFLCTQGPKDWIDRRGDDWATLTQNINVAIIMRQGEPEAANLCAEYFGKKLKTKTTESIAQTTGLFGDQRVRDASGKIVDRFNVSQELDYRIPPDTFRELTIGQAFIRVGAPNQRIEFTRVQLRDPRTSPGR